MKPDHLKMQVGKLKDLIADAHQRMATNRDPAYRAVQQKKIDNWLEEMTKLHEEHHEQWIKEVF